MGNFKEKELIQEDHIYDIICNLILEIKAEYDEQSDDHKRMFEETLRKKKNDKDKKRLLDDFQEQFKQKNKSSDIKSICLISSFLFTTFCFNKRTAIAKLLSSAATSLGITTLSTTTIILASTVGIIGGLGLGYFILRRTTRVADEDDNDEPSFEKRDETD